jgi:DNA-binding Lrp family transcriptional regulator
MKAEIMTRERQSILGFIISYKSLYGRTPSLKKIANACGLSKTTAHYHVKRLAEAGLLRKGRYTRAEVNPEEVKKWIESVS